MPREGIFKKTHTEIMRQEDFVTAARVAASMGINKIRITGGEPLLKKGIVSLCEEIVTINGIDSVNLTTNGILLGDLAKDLKSAGIKNLNVSLDTLDTQKYKEITGGGRLEDVLQGIESALEQGFEQVKVNTVLMAGVNDGEVASFVKFAHKKSLEVRFIELMPIGEGLRGYNNKYLSADWVVKSQPNLVNAGLSQGVSQMYDIPGSKGRIGLIRPMSISFCNACNRLRLTADGKLKPCLHSGEEISIRGLTECQIKEIMEKAILCKPQNMEEAMKNPRGARNMNEIGG